MKNLLFILTLLIACGCANKTDKENQPIIGIEFSSGSFDKAIKMAKDLNKPIFVDFTTTWCGPCKKMDNFVFTDSIIEDFYNTNFICLKYDAEKGEGITLKNKFEIDAYPTLLFLSPQLEIKLKHVGYKGPKDFLELGYTALNEKPSDNTIPNALANYDEDIKKLNEFGTFLSATSAFEKDFVLFDYFQDIPQKKWFTPQYFIFIENESYSIFSPLSKFVLANRNKYAEVFGKERIDKYISRLMGFAFRTPKDLYGLSYNDLTDDDINTLIWRELSKIDSVFASKNKLNHEINLLSLKIVENYNDTEIWNSLFTKVAYYNKHYLHFDKEWHNFLNNWHHRLLQIIPYNLEVKDFNETLLKRAKSRLTESDYNEFAADLCFGTVERFVSSPKQTENSKKELTVALSILASSNAVSKVWANDFVSSINVSDEAIINYKKEVIKNAL